MTTELKTEVLMDVLRRARPFIAWDARPQSALAPGHQEYARKLLIEIDAALYDLDQTEHGKRT